MTVALYVLHLGALLLLPILVIGVINRTRAIWAGRRGPPLLQTWFDLRRLLRKQPVYSEVTTSVFRVGPLVVLASALASGAFVPMLRDFAPWPLGFDFVAVAYLWGLGRMAMMLAALDAGSSFEGMGASREATYGALVEPALFLALGTLALVTGGTSFSQLMNVGFGDPARAVIVIGCAVALLIVLQAEAARVPVDDPATHLELTMIHEVMILDHSGPELAALQYSAAMKLTVCAALVASLLNPVPAQFGAVAVAGANLALTLVVAIVVGLIEGLVARLKLSAIPQYLTVAVVAAFVALLAATWLRGGAA